MKITLYNNKSDQSYLSKNITRIGQPIECVVKDLKQVETPTFEIDAAALPDWYNVNYAYVERFNRYYHVKVSLDTANRLVIECRVDALMSFATYIRQIKCTILRQEQNFSPYFQDGNLAKRVNRKYVYKQVGKLPNGQSNILTVDGGDVQ